MDQIKIGKFIAETRKEQNLTQLDLAEKLGISNKTVSKWECGNGMPDYSVMEGLCEILKINVNELLSGERLPSQEYTKKAEENMMSLMQESTENYKRERREFIVVMVGVATLLVLILLAIMAMWGGSGVAEIANFIDIPTFLFLFVVTTIVLFMIKAGKDFIKGFSLAIRKNTSNMSYEIQKSMLAMKTVLVTVNIAGVLSFSIGLVISLKEWSAGELESLPMWVAVAFLSIVYSLIATLILIPIYMRLKAKLIEE